MNRDQIIIVPSPFSGPLRGEKSVRQMRDKILRESVHAL